MYEGVCVYCGTTVVVSGDVVEPTLEAKQEAYTVHMKGCVKHPYYEQHQRTLDAYQVRAEQTAIYRVKIDERFKPIFHALDVHPNKELARQALVELSRIRGILHLWYPVLGMCGEAGEIANKIKKVLRDGTFDALDLGKEDGDVLWYVADFASQLELSLGLISEGNIQKLAERRLAGTIEGSGDNR